ncbi:HET-domain-containing protein [Nemania sp. FL0916]|nr:HET-domain-containing protein [Nemania sp. FL0916]
MLHSGTPLRAAMRAHEAPSSYKSCASGLKGSPVEAEPATCHDVVGPLKRRNRIPRHKRMGSLCDICQAIPFRELQENPNQNFKIDFGGYDEVKRRLPCPFCRLALDVTEFMANAAGYSDAKKFLKIEALGKVEVWWSPSCHEFSIGFLPFRYTRGPSRSLARIVGPAPIAIEPITSLLEDCEATHCCSIPVSEEDATRLPVLRAIDVHQMCITSIKPSTRYVTLSYVWGKVSIPRLVQANKEELMTPGALWADRTTMPLTIRDAIELARNLNFQYLWVDALCLVHDDTEDLRSGISAMSIIYEHSHLTIIAADGHDASVGLRGVSPRKANRLSVEVMPGVEIVGCVPIGEILPITPYGKRAWTFQEFHLSRRKLIFYDSRVYYHCPERSWSEDVDGEQIDPRIQHCALAPTKPNRRFYDFQLVIEEYSNREATYEHDIINAVTSVYYRMLGRDYGAHFSGVPIVAFEYFICFRCPDPGLKYLKRRVSLPSWAWTGWIGNRAWARNLEDDNEVLLWISENTWIIWYTRDEAGNLVTIWNLSHQTENGSRAPREQILAQRIDSSQRFSTSFLPILPTRPAPSRMDCHPNFLQFWTLSAYFSLRMDTKGQWLSEPGTVNWRVAQEIRGPDNKYYGFIYTDEKSMERDHDNAELIVISKTDRPMPFDHEFIYMNRNWSRLPEDCFYNVLYIEDISGISERKGFGQIFCPPIHLEADSPWKWKEILLG